MAQLIDTDILVYRADARFPLKQQIARELLREGLADGSLVVPHQAIVEFVAAASGQVQELPPLYEPGN